MRETFVLDDLFNSIIELEKKGNIFYTDLAEKTDIIEIKEIFTVLAKAEKRHENLYRNLKDKFTEPEEIDEEYKEYLDHLIKSSFTLNDNELESYKDLKKAFNFALNLEKDTIIFLNELKDLLSENGQGAIKTVIKEERGHIIAINKLSNKYS